MKRFCVIVVTGFALGVAVADDIPWTYDTSKRAVETTSSGESAESAVEARSVSVLDSAETSVDARFLDWLSSLPIGLDTTKIGFLLFLR